MMVNLWNALFLRILTVRRTKGENVKDSCQYKSSESLNSGAAQTSTSEHGYECIVFLFPFMAATAIILDCLLDTTTEFGLLPVLRPCERPELVCSEFDGCQKLQGIVVRLRMQRIGNDSSRFNRCHYNKVSSLVNADIRAFGECGNDFVVALQANDCIREHLDHLQDLCTYEEKGHIPTIGALWVSSWKTPTRPMYDQLSLPGLLICILAGILSLVPKL
jgi:hypothetical protein